MGVIGVEYWANNSGGYNWIDDEDWEALEKAGWEIGGMRTWAIRYGRDLEAAIDEWEKVTNKSASEGGCPCCGPPHEFREILSRPTIDDLGDLPEEKPYVEVDRELLLRAIEELQEWSSECGEIESFVLSEEEEESYSERGTRIDDIIEGLRSAL